MVVDKFSKMVHVMPCTKKTGTTETCHMLELGIFRLHGIFKDMVCDRDGKFTNTEFAALADAFGIERLFSTSFHPESDGQTGRAYFSSKFSYAEQRYNTTEQERLGAIKALKVWRCYLEGCVHLIVQTDHAANTYLPTQTRLSGRHARWQEFLSRFSIH